MNVNKMNKNKYWEKAKSFRNEVIEKFKIIFQLYGNEL